MKAPRRHPYSTHENLPNPAKDDPTFWATLGGELFVISYAAAVLWLMTVLCSVAGLIPVAIVFGIVAALLTAIPGVGVTKAVCHLIIRFGPRK